LQVFSCPAKRVYENRRNRDTGARRKEDRNGHEREFPERLLHFFRFTRLCSRFRKSLWAGQQERIGSIPETGVPGWSQLRTGGVSIQSHFQRDGSHHAQEVSAATPLQKNSQPFEKAKAMRKLTAGESALDSFRLTPARDVLL